MSQVSTPPARGYQRHDLALAGGTYRAGVRYFSRRSAFTGMARNVSLDAPL